MTHSLAERLKQDELAVKSMLQGSLIRGGVLLGSFLVLIAIACALLLMN
jgi:hypothetical protein